MCGPPWKTNAVIGTVVGMRTENQWLPFQFSHDHTAIMRWSDRCHDPHSKRKGRRNDRPLPWRFWTWYAPWNPYWRAKSTWRLLHDTDRMSTLYRYRGQLDLLNEFSRRSCYISYSGIELWGSHALVEWHNNSSTLESHWLNWRDFLSRSRPISDSSVWVLHVDA